MANKHSDLIAIANPKLAKKLDTKIEKEEKKAALKQELKELKTPDHQTFQQEVWRAVFVLNLLRYGLAIGLFVFGLVSVLKPDFRPISSLTSPEILLYLSGVLLCSAAAFTYLTHYRKAPLSVILVCQFVLDILLTAILVHFTGSISSSFTILFFVVVTTGSVVLSRRPALALASGALFAMFYEHFYSVLLADQKTDWRFDSLAVYGVLLMIVAYAISHFAQILRRSESKSYTPGNESIEDFLVREEINALKSALAATDGNKTEAAKLIGMTFRSFRYKLTKYGIQ